MRAVLVPGVLALLPQYASLDDPVAPLRAACLRATRWLGEAGSVEVVGSPQGVRVGRNLLGAAGIPATSTTGERGWLLVGNGSARRSERAPGHLDERSFAFDEQLAKSLRAGAFDADLTLAGELLADVEAIRRFPRVAAGLGPAIVDYDDDPFGVRYWVMRWEP